MPLTGKTGIGETDLRIEERHLAEAVAASDLFPRAIKRSIHIRQAIDCNGFCCLIGFSVVLRQYTRFQRRTVGEIVGTRSTKRISAASLPKLSKTPGYHHDGGGLYLQVMASGSRSWIFRYMLNKRPREMGLGSADNWDLTTIRQRVVELRQQLDLGIDPIEQRNDAQRKAATAEALRKTFKQCVEEYHLLHAGAWKNVKHASQWTNTLVTYAYPTFGEWPIDAVTDVQVVTALTPIWTSKHETATRVLQRVRMVMTWAAAKKYRPAVPAEMWDSVRASLPKVDRGTEHHRACPYTLAGSLLLRIQSSESTAMVKLAFTFTVLTAARSGETRGARWEEIDLQNRVWTIPAERMKAGRIHRVPLSDPAVAVLQRAKEEAPDTDLVFPAPRGSAYSDMVFTQLLRRMAADCTMHGFRSTFRDWSAETTQHQRAVCEAALAHAVEDKTEAAYLRGDLFVKRRALMADWAAYLASTADTKWPVLKKVALSD